MSEANSPFGFLIINVVVSAQPPDLLSLPLFQLKHNTHPAHY